MNKLETLQKEYARARQDDLVARKVLTTIQDRLNESGAALAENLAATKLNVFKGTLLNRSANYKAGNWLVQALSVSQSGLDKPPSIWDVKIHCRRQLKAGNLGSERACFYGGDLIKDDRFDNRSVIVIKSQPGEKGGEANGAT